ncbi:MAG TPA: methylaspartate mutase subunit E [Erysipelotrichaceae bacterium]|nr:MAG: methylaspartate mutase subunit E [Firmicutes bacterium GWE2_51_13]HBZ42439.1 methylaspartate mutase subunit E [Erysipelotrichaceae bacterium]
MNNGKIPTRAFLEMRKEVLNQWITGKEVVLDEAIAYQASIQAEKRFSARLAKAIVEKETLVQPRAGVALPAEHIKLLKHLQDEGTADLLPTTIDSYTRHNRYHEAQTGIDESVRTGKSLLNGFPAVNHGVSVCRNIVESLNVPLQVRHGTPDARLLAEITLAGGFTSFEGGGISYNIPYGKNNSLEKTITDWQYVDRLVGYYEEKGIRINREPFGPLTGTLVPPCISHSVAILESLLAAQQGCKCITVGYGQCGNQNQDIAAIRTLEKLTKEYLGRFGYRDVVVSTVFHQWMGGFPQDEAKAYAVIGWGAATAVLSGATKVIVKSPHEAFGVPTAEANANGLKTSKQLTVMLKDQIAVETPLLVAEMDIIEKETRSILEAVLKLGNNDFGLSALRGFEAGLIDVPFAPAQCNANKALPARDNNGAIRFLDFGNLPFDEDIKAFHRQKLQERADVERRDVSFQMVIDDIYAVSKGRLVGRPR